MPASIGASSPGGPAATLGAPDMADDVVSRAVELLRAGAAIVLPTDTVYGLAALPSVPGATDQLWRLKGRQDDKPLAVLVADADQARTLLDVSENHRRVADAWIDRFWPGALTIVARRRPAARNLELGPTAGDTIGVRCPADPTVRAIASKVGPIAATSANRSGTPTPRTAAEATASLLGSVDLVIDGGPGGALASTVVDLTGGPWRILREGPISRAELLAAPGSDDGPGPSAKVET